MHAADSSSDVFRPGFDFVSHKSNIFNSKVYTQSQDFALGRGKSDEKYNFMWLDTNNFYSFFGY